MEKLRIEINFKKKLTCFSSAATSAWRCLNLSNSSSALLNCLRAPVSCLFTSSSSIACFSSFFIKEDRSPYTTHRNSITNKIVNWRCQISAASSPKRSLILTFSCTLLTSAHVVNISWCRTESIVERLDDGGDDFELRLLYKRVLVTPLRQKE